ncbi:MAG TPA: filamentous hemagglutinin N-terminal domain-containing protein, partial [Alphaproteobacteria bacterium]|nr:filamentous hemagglutinin N-terminal domain-containing protein [Alphaproteobacteria bacterium]
MEWQQGAALRNLLLATSCLVSAGTVATTVARAQPTNPAVTAGQATISTSPNSTVVRQSTSKAIIQWQSFSIPSGDSVTFVQPGASAIALNRVTGGQASSIYGSLTANGQVWLVNPNGVLFGNGAQVNVAGLLATTSDIRDQDFLAGNYNFGIASSNPNASIVNQGTITAASGGSVVLSAASVSNTGLIQAQFGSVVVAGAKTFTVDFNGDNLLSYQVTGAVDQVPLDANGNPVSSLVSNSGTLSAPGGTVLVTARAAQAILDNVINTSGMVQATTAKNVNGTIVLDAGEGGVAVSGTLDGSGRGAGQTGGSVEVLGGSVNLAPGAKIDVSGDAGGGVALVGGNFHGAGPQANATTTTVAAGATILADAVTTGNGGQVAVWSDGTTTFNGTISARGGAQGGNGGTVETSGEGALIVGPSASVNASATMGTAGQWLLDPLAANSNVTISLGSTSGGTFAGGTNTPSADSSVINVNAITTNSLDLGTSVVITTTCPSGCTGASLGDITVATAIMKTAGASATLTLTAADSIFVNQPISSTSAGNALSVNLTATSGSVNIANGISTDGGSFAATASNGGISLTGSGRINTNVSPNTSVGGNVTLTAGSGGINLNPTNASPTVVTTGGGTFMATSGGSGNFSDSSGITTSGVTGVDGGNVSITSVNTVSIGGEILTGDANVLSD